MSFDNQNSSRITPRSTNYDHQSYKKPILMTFSSEQPKYPMSVPSHRQNHSSFHSNSIKHNRIAPQTLELDRNSQPHTEQSNKMQLSSPSHVKTMDKSYPYNLNHYTDENSDVDVQGKTDQTSCFSKPLCYGLTRLTGGILFGSMLILGIGSIAGFLVSIIFYEQDPTTNPQWKILGIAVTVVMFVTVLTTFFMFFYCYHKGRIVANDAPNNPYVPEYIEDNQFKNSNNYNQSAFTSPVPYEVMQNRSSASTYDDTIYVEDKQTNTEVSMGVVRANDIKRGVWPAINAYGGVSNHPLHRPDMVNHHTQTISHKKDLSMTLRNTIGKLEIHHQNNKEQNANGLFASKQYHTPFSNTIGISKGSPPVEDYAEFDDRAQNFNNEKPNRKKIRRYQNVSIKRVKPVEETNVV